MASSIDGVLASIDQVQSLSPDDFTRVIEHWKRHAAKLWAGPLLQQPMHGPTPPPPSQTSSIGVGVSVIQTCQNAPPTPATENNEPPIMPPFPVPAPLAVPGPPIIKPKRKSKSSAAVRNGNNNNGNVTPIININANNPHPSDPPTTPSTAPSTWPVTARKRLDAKMLSLKDHTVPQPTNASLQLAVEKLRYFVIRALHPNLQDGNKGGENCLGLILRRAMNFDGYLNWVDITSTEGDEGTRRLAQVWFFYKMAEILNSFCEDEKRRGEGANEQGRLQRGYDKLVGKLMFPAAWFLREWSGVDPFGALPICKRILDTDNRQYIRNLICSSRRFRQLCIHMVGAGRAELFVFFKGELTLTDLKDMTASAAKMGETIAMLDIVLDDYLTTVESIEVPVDGDLTGVRIDMWNGVLEI